MKYCSKCGKELLDEAVICMGCGCQVSGAPVAYKQAGEKVESSALATSAIVLAFLMPLIGLILGIVGMSKYNDPQLKSKAKGAIFLSLGMWIVYFVIFSAMSQM